MDPRVISASTRVFDALLPAGGGSRWKSLSPASCPARSQTCADCVNLSALPGIHVLPFVDATRRGWHRNSGLPEFRTLDAASRVNSTCGDKPGHDGGGWGAAMTAEWSPAVTEITH